jgi:hypothetical protein
VAASRTLIEAYKSAYNIAELRAMLRTALDERASGVQVTQVNFQDGGGSGQMIGGDPNEVIEALKIAIDELADPTSTGNKPLAAAVNFSRRRSET